MKKYFKINGDLRLTPETVEVRESDLHFTSLADTSYHTSEGNHRENLPVYSNGERQLMIPVDEVPEELAEQVALKGTWNVFLRNRAEILRSFQLLMKHDPRCLLLRSNRY